VNPYRPITPLPPAPPAPSRWSPYELGAWVLLVVVSAAMPLFGWTPSPWLGWFMLGALGALQSLRCGLSYGYACGRREEHEAWLRASGPTQEVPEPEGSTVGRVRGPVPYGPLVPRDRGKLALIGAASLLGVAVLAALGFGGIRWATGTGWQWPTTPPVSPEVARITPAPPPSGSFVVPMGSALGYQRLGGEQVWFPTNECSVACLRDTVDLCGRNPETGERWRYCASPIIERGIACSRACNGP
jgi:hypothetical protein